MNKNNNLTISPEGTADTTIALAQRQVPQAAAAALELQGVHPVLAGLLAARGVKQRQEFEGGLADLLPPSQLKGIDDAARLLADAIAAGRRLVIVADYDCDGATACAIGVRALRALITAVGSHASPATSVGYLVPDRFRFGYGLTPPIVELAARDGAQLLITVDNGIASIEGVAAANAIGLPVLVTDHHLPGDALPAAAAIVNPNQPGCSFPSKALAGCGVMFYVMLALRAECRLRGWLAADGGPNLGELLDLVAVGTVADVVALDRNNRILVAQGLQRIRKGRLCQGLRALFAVAGRATAGCASFDLGFVVGPRLNAAGRLDDMSVGIECLLTDDAGRAAELARRLDDLNRERRDIEAGMRDQAEAVVAGIELSEAAAITLYDASWHQGVVGIVAGRIKDRMHRPTIAFAPGDAGEVKGSGRSIPGLHLREPGLILRFGGHSMAAGLTLREADVARFRSVFEGVVRELLEPGALARRIDTDGPLSPAYLNLDTASLLEQQVWGQAFPQPLFLDQLTVQSQRIVGGRHAKLKVQLQGRNIEAMQFNALQPLPERIRAAYRLSVNEFNGVRSVQLLLEHWEPAAGSRQ
jgi:single-stranded-DNA-specific exonuclease